MIRAQTVGQLHSALRPWRAAGERVALVPTMGDLHAGHLSLVRMARGLADRVAVSVFVNPLQFGDSADLAAYPRTPDADARKLEAAGVDLGFFPSVAVMYPNGMEAAARVEVPALDGFLEGRRRPGHFTGVATVVSKLFNLATPDVAVFGEKDFQQLLVVRRLVADLCYPVQIVAAPTVREDDGLAMSSRNARLDEQGRRRAPALYAALAEACARLEAGGRDYAAIEAHGLARLERDGIEPEYFSVRAAADLARPGDAEADLVVLAAGRIGGVRLIDNLRARVAA